MENTGKEGLTNNDEWKEKFENCCDYNGSNPYNLFRSDIDYLKKWIESNVINPLQQRIAELEQENKGQNAIIKDLQDVIDAHYQKPPDKVLSPEEVLKKHWIEVIRYSEKGFNRIIKGSPVYNVAIAAMKEYHEQFKGDKVKECWIEVPVDNPPNIKGQPEFINCVFKEGDIKGQWYHPEIHLFHPEITHWLKKVTIPDPNNQVKGLTDEEIEGMAKKEFPITEDSTFSGILQNGYVTGFKAAQEYFNNSKTFSDSEIEDIAESIYGYIGDDQGEYLRSLYRKEGFIRGVKFRSQEQE